MIQLYETGSYSKKNKTKQNINFMLKKQTNMNESPQYVEFRLQMKSKQAVDNRS